MITNPGSRLAIAIVLLVLQSLIFIIELLIFTHVRTMPWYSRLRQVVGPVSIASLVAILTPLAFADASKHIDAAVEQCNASVDGDIAGQGAQIAVWTQVGVLLIISLLGSFHTSATGAKEVGAGLVLTHASLSIALLAQMRLGTLSSADAIVGSMILDAQNVGLSIQLAAKETLAARWQVQVVVLAQIFGLIVIPVLVSNFSDGTFASDDCRCLTLFWWAWLSSCGSTAVGEVPVFWTYYACRCVGFVQVCFHSLYNTSKFDEAEKSERAVVNSRDQAPDAVALEEQPLGAGPPTQTEEQGDVGSNAEQNRNETEERRGNRVVRGSEQQDDTSINDHPEQHRNDEEGRRDNKGKSAARGNRLRRVTHLYRRRNGQVVYFREYPATVTLMYTVYGAFSLGSMGIAQTTVANFNLKSPSPIDSVGQVISLIVAAATIGRAAWLFFMLFRGETQNNEWNFVWPFMWHDTHDPLRRHMSAWRHFVFCSPLSRDLDPLPLGSLLKEPFDPNSRVAGNFTEPPEAMKTHDHDSSLSISCTRGANQYYTTIEKAAQFDTSLFEPNSSSLASYVTERLHGQHPQLLANGEEILYMVTGTIVAGRVTIYIHPSDNMLSSRLDVELAIETMVSYESDHLFGYRLHIVRRSSPEGSFVVDGIYLPEEDW